MKGCPSWTAHRTPGEHSSCRKDAIEPGKKVVVIDDLLATGGTVGATCKLLKKAGADVKAAAFVIELQDLQGRKNLPQDIDVVSMITY